MTSMGQLSGISPYYFALHIDMQRDYHAIFIHKRKKSSFVYDLDSRFPLPTPFNLYYEKTLNSQGLGKRNQTALIFFQINLS